MVIPIGSDHAGFETKQILIAHLIQLGYEVKDYGCYSDQSIDYPDYAHPVAEHIEANPGSLGILLCGSGNGISMTANKHQGIRCALCWTAEIAELARQHNDANIISMPARFISVEEAKQMVEIFLNTAFEGGRHATRVAKISC
ncbi:MAG: ribose 5-phosphate isomerase B [Flavobacteriia bacterium]|jgi:ribose 5-phosphate isomerase B|nr:ribose 5-phosphate isomerase B [Cryomorphaceae bacterium]